MTIEQIKTLPSYEALKRNGLSDDNIVQYYSLPRGQRVAFFNSFKNGNIERAIQEPSSRGTQKCMVDIDNVRDMALEYMEKDFEVNGRIFNMRKLGWSFGFNTNRSRFGLCRRRKNRYSGTISMKKLFLSSWLIENSDKDFNGWKNTMLHEIAHAIDVEIRGKSGHDYHWRRIALAIGCDGKRCSTAKVSSEKSKYTIVCPNGHEQAGHKFSRRIADGRISCGKCSPRFDKRYILKQVQNY